MNRLPTANEILEAAFNEADGSVVEAEAPDADELTPEKIEKMAAALRGASGYLIKVATWMDPELGGRTPEQITGAWSDRPSQTDGVKDLQELRNKQDQQEATFARDFAASTSTLGSDLPEAKWHKHEAGLSLAQLKSRLAAHGLPGGANPQAAMKGKTFGVAPKGSGEPKVEGYTRAI